MAMIALYVPDLLILGLPMTPTAIVIYNYDRELAEWIAHFQGS